jgi:two-component sensor histidine kinase
VVGASKIARDISARKRAEDALTKAAEMQDLLIAELSHRVKNTLATVVSIADQSFSRGQPFEHACQAFKDRIRALGQTHGRLAEANWSGVSFETILLDELAPYRRYDGGNVHLSGPPVTLTPRQALSLGMAIHELSTNAAKHGALSSESGSVQVAWQVDAQDRRLTIEWIESGGPVVAQPEPPWVRAPAAGARPGRRCRGRRRIGLLAGRSPLPDCLAVIARSRSLNPSRVDQQSPQRSIRAESDQHWLDTCQRKIKRRRGAGGRYRQSQDDQRLARTGDAVVARTSDAIRKSIRRGDECARLGDEFLIYAPDCDAEGAKKIAGAILARLSGQGMPLVGRRSACRSALPPTRTGLRNTPACIARPTPRCIRPERKAETALSCSTLRPPRRCTPINRRESWSSGRWLSFWLAVDAKSGAPIR